MRSIARRERRALNQPYPNAPSVAPAESVEITMPRLAGSLSSSKYAVNTMDSVGR